MFCPSCNFQNEATSVRCMQCHTVLIEGVVHESHKASSQTEGNDPPSRSANAKGVAASLIGGVVGIYAGLNVLVPAFGAGAIWFLGRRIITPAQSAYLPAVSTQVGHAFWLALGSVITGSWAATGGDLVILSIGLIWLWFKPSLWPLAILCIYQVGSLGVNSYMLMQQHIGSVQHKALVVHIALRVLALFYLWQGFRASRDGEFPTQSSQRTASNDR